MPVTVIVGGGSWSVIDAEAVPTLPAASATWAITVFRPSAPPSVSARVAAYGSQAVQVAPPSVEKRIATGPTASVNCTLTTTLPVVVTPAPPSRTIVPRGVVVSTTSTWNVFTVVLPAASFAVTVTVVVPSANVVPGSCEYVIVGVDTASVAVAAKSATAPAGLAASAVMSDGTVSDGGVVSTTSTWNVFTVVLPAASFAVTVTVVVPSANVVPGSCEYVIVGVDTASVAVAAKLATAPAGLAASAVMSDGTVSHRGLVSTTV